MVARGMERDRFSRGVVVPAFCQRPARLDAHASQVLMAADAPWRARPYMLRPFVLRTYLGSANPS